MYLDYTQFLNNSMRIKLHELYMKVVLLEICSSLRTKFWNFAKSNSFHS